MASTSDPPDRKIEDLVKLLFASSLFSRSSEKKLAVNSSNGNTTEADCDMIKILGSEIHPNPYLRKNFDGIFKQKSIALQRCMVAAKCWHNNENVSQQLQDIMSSPYMLEEASKPNFFQPSKTLVFWNYEDCVIPTDFDDITSISSNIHKALALMDICAGEIKILAIGEKKVLTAGVRLDLQRQGIRYVNAPHELWCNKVTADKQMIVEVMGWANEHVSEYNEPTTVVAITNDVDFRLAMRRLIDEGFYVVISTNEGADYRLSRVAQVNPNMCRHVVWDAFIRGKTTLAE